jgi:predicted transcriptional regulator
MGRQDPLKETCRLSPKRYPVVVSAAMHTAKETVRRLLDDLPDNASLEDIQHHIYVREKIERGLRDVEAGRVVDQDEAKRRMAKWLGE